jgi:hypothetical protein
MHAVGVLAKCGQMLAPFDTQTLRDDVLDLQLGLLEIDNLGVFRSSRSRISMR